MGRIVGRPRGWSKGRSTLWRVALCKDSSTKWILTLWDGTDLWSMPLTAWCHWRTSEASPAVLKKRWGCTMGNQDEGSGFIAKPWSSQAFISRSEPNYDQHFHEDSFRERRCFPMWPSLVGPSPYGTLSGTLAQLHNHSELGWWWYLRGETILLQSDGFLNRLEPSSKMVHSNPCWNITNKGVWSLLQSREVGESRKCCLFICNDINAILNGRMLWSQQIQQNKS